MRDVLKEALERWQRSPAGIEASISSANAPQNGTGSICGLWTELFPNTYDLFWKADTRTVYDPLRDRMLIIGDGSHNNANGFAAWALDFTPTVALTDLAPADASGSLGDAGATALYDAARDRVLAFGGSVSSGSPGGVYALSLAGTPTWSYVETTGDEPLARMFHTAIHDVTGDRMIVFGGRSLDGGTFFSDVWALTLSGTPTWTQLSPTGTGPGQLVSHSAVYDGPRNRMVVFGGYDENYAGHNEAWALSLSGSGAWTQINTSGGTPQPRSGHTAIVNATGNRMLVFAGFGDTDFFDDVWELSFTNQIKWTQVAASGSPPAPYLGFSSILDPIRNRMVTVVEDEVWALGNLAGTPTWSMIEIPGDIPRHRQGAAGVFDAPRQRLLALGGNKSIPTGGFLRGNDLWAFTFASGTWSRLATSGLRPSRRAHASAVYDAVGDRVVVFGGTGVTAVLNDTWIFSPATGSWSLMNPTGTPPPARYAHTAILDAPRNRMIVYGGSNDGATPFNDVWSLSLAGGGTWSQLSPAGGPAPGRQLHTATFDAPRDRMLTFGWDSNVVWSLSLAGAPAWSMLATNGTPPPTLVAHSATYDPTRDRMLLRNEVTYALDLAGTPTWNSVIENWVPIGDYSATSVFDSVNDRWVLFAGSFDNFVYSLSFPPSFAITTSASPTNGGSVGQSPTGPCQPEGSLVTLTAVPAATYAFTGWSGDASGTTNPLLVTMDAAKNITANFDNFSLNVTVSPAGSGSVGRSPDLLNYPPNTDVTLTASAALGYGFSHWSGDAGGSGNPLVVAMSSTKNITANFVGYPVTVTVLPVGSGTVTRSPNYAQYAPGTQVTLTASTSPYPFLGWSGDASGTTNPLVITVDGPKNITASFGAYSLTTIVDPTGSGGVTRFPNQTVYAAGADVTLSAVPAPGSGFVSWSGDLSGTNVNELLTMDGNKTVTAHFAVLPPVCGGWALQPGQTPPVGRNRATAIWDPVRQRMLLYGGQATDPVTVSYVDLWELAFGPSPTWTRVSPPPLSGGPQGFQGFFDPVRDRMLLFGGSIGVSFPTSDLYAWTLTPSVQFALVTTSGTAPAGRAGPYVIYDPLRDRLLLFGGMTRCGMACTALQNDLWQITLSGTPTWSPLGPLGTPPPPTSGGGAIYDPVRDRMVVFGGSPVPLGGAWALSLAGTPTWTNLNPSGTPHVGSAFHSAYDPVRDRIVVVNPSDPSRISVLDFKDQPNQPRWSQAVPERPLMIGGRPGSTFAYSPTLDAGLLFGGGPTNNWSNQTFRLDLSGGYFLDGGGTNGSVSTDRWCYEPGTIANLLAVPTAGYEFLQWTGDATGTANPTQLTMDAYKVVQAVFQPRAVEVGSGAPASFALGEVHPNPSSGPVRLSYALPAESRVRLAIYDLSGRQVARLVEGTRPAGRHEVTWNGPQIGANSGLFFVRLETPAGSWVRRVAIVR